MLMHNISAERRSRDAYLVGLLIILGSAHSQYHQKALKNTYSDAKFGLGFFGAFTLLGLLGEHLVYGAASVIQFTDLVAFGMAIAAEYYFSGGNVLVPAIIHGVYDAVGFLGVAISPGVAAMLRGLMILIGLLVALALFIQRRRSRTPHTGA